MKKYLTLLLIPVFLFIITISAKAAPAPKNREVIASASAYEVNVGDTVELTFTTVKHGSFYVDSYNGGVKIDTIYNSRTESYISTGTFVAKEPGIYTVIYTISMGAGKSQVTFTGTATVTITVIQPAEIVGATVKNVVATPVYNNQGNLTGYNVVCDIYALWSNGEETFYDTLVLKSILRNQESKNHEVVVNGTKYVVVISRT